MRRGPRRRVSCTPEWRKRWNRNLHLPLLIKRKADGFQSVLGNVTLAVEVPKRYRGTHMSRLVAIVFKWSQKPLGGHDVKQILEQVRQSLKVDKDLKLFLVDPILEADPI